MHKFLAALLIMMAGTPALAQECPGFFRFVDFGLEGPDGVLRRGGTIFRAFDADRTHLLIPELTQCRAVDDLAKDGHGNPIPVVTSIAVDPKIAGVDVRELRLARTRGASLVADENAAQHRAWLEGAETAIIRGSDHVCASAPGTDAISCQLSSPYPGQFPLVVYCDAQLCRMPVLARDKHLIVSASWRRGTMDPGDTGQEISDTIKQIHAFWERYM